MIEEEAYVTEVAAGKVWVSSENRSACSGCSQACPSSLADGLFGKKQVRLMVSSCLALHPGDRVIIGISENALAIGSILVYLLPLFALFGGAILGKLIGSSDISSALGGLAGLIICYTGLKFTRFLERRDYQPVILRKID